MLPGIVVNLVVPLIGVGIYLRLCRKMWRSQIQSPPFISYFFLFVNFGGCLLIVLTALFWEWSGMASLGFCYLLLVSPFVSGAIAWTLYRRREISRFHRAGYVAGLVYEVLVVVLLCVLYANAAVHV